MGLVLAAAGIPYRIVEAEHGWDLAVAAGDVRAAEGALAGWDAERARPQIASDGSAHRRTASGLVVAALLLGFHALTGPALGGSRWFERGSASARDVLNGEPWRAVTALTLHVDAAHVVGNALACAVFVTALAHVLGPGLGVFLVLVAGVAGNVLDVLLRGGAHATVGASTAVFGAIGILGGLQARRASSRRPAWIPIAASVALLALLGTGERSDLLAHLFGLLVGLMLGVVASTLPRPRAATQAALAAGALGAVAAAWTAAFRG
jgi:membrane associated rhomboid family serine protease